MCKRELDEREEVSGFLDAEGKLGGLDSLNRCLIEWFKENVGDEWLEWDSQELVGELAGLLFGASILWLRRMLDCF